MLGISLMFTILIILHYFHQLYKCNEFIDKGYQMIINRNILSFCFALILFVLFFRYESNLVAANSPEPIFSLIEKSDDKSNYIVSEVTLEKSNFFDLKDLILEEKYSAYKVSESDLLYVYVISDNTYRRLLVDIDKSNDLDIKIPVQKNEKTIVYSLPQYSDSYNIKRPEKSVVNYLGGFQVNLPTEYASKYGVKHRVVYMQNISDISDGLQVFKLYDESVRNDKNLLGEYRFFIEK